MSRNIRSEAIVLRTARMQEFHKSVALLTPEHGVVRAIAHGAYKGKGKLGASTEPFVSGTAYLYHEPVKDSYKVSEMEVRSFHEGIRASLEKLYTASMWAEVLLKSYGGGGGTSLFALLDESLDRIDEAERVAPVSLQFLWRFVVLQGFSPDLDRCAECGRPFREQESVFYSEAAEELRCAACAAAADATLELTAGALRYLRFTEGLPLAQALTVGLEERSRTLLERFERALVQSIVEVPILTLASGVL